MGSSFMQLVLRGALAGAWACRRLALCLSRAGRQIKPVQPEPAARDWMPGMAWLYCALHHTNDQSGQGRGLRPSATDHKRMPS
ncbi:MAG: hypothetical protein CL812_13190 [Confluentimicrobium sp.]|nr:hypothetical protein [Actibacterium sp.]